MQFSGLSLDQAPPIDLPFRFFFTAPLFAVLAALIVLTGDAQLLGNRFTPQAIALVHLFTIGVFGMVMVGALQQMLPVLAGVALPFPRLVATFSHLLITVGLLCMVWGLSRGATTASLAGSVLLGGGFFIILFSVLWALRKVAYATPTTRAMRLSVLFAIAATGLGAHLLAAHGTGSMGDSHLPLAAVHSVWAIFGFAGILIIGVAFQVLPMFYVTPGFKKFCKRYVPSLIGVGLLVWGVLAFTAPAWMWTAKLELLLFFFAFGVVIWLKLARRRRPVSDVTVWYWRTGAAMLLAGMAAWNLVPWGGEKLHLSASVLVGGFLFSIITGMLYKIVPFLVWFHLNGAGYLSIPTVREMIDEWPARCQYAFFVASVIAFVLAPWSVVALKTGAVLLLCASLLLFYILLQVLALYRKMRKTAPDFPDISS